MGTNNGNGNAGNDLAGPLQNQGQHATEYTLQGVMRFLQTEWHRHERDRNAWEIEKQEMKARIASLEGSARRADATQKALKKYVSILENKVKTQAAQLKGDGEDTAADAKANNPEADRAAKIQEKLQAPSKLNNESGMEGIELERIADDEAQRSELKAFLDQCQAEFTYLMITPANPLPPRESPPLPLLDDLRENDAFGLPASIPATHAQQQQIDHGYPQARSAQDRLREMPQARSMGNHQAPPAQGVPSSNYAVKNADAQSAPMTRSNVDRDVPLFNNANSNADWPPTASVTTRQLDESDANSNSKHANRNENGQGQMEKQGLVDADGWDFNEGNFDPSAAQQQPQVISNRPDTDVFPTADSIPKSPNRGPTSHRRKTSMSRRRSAEQELSLNALAQKAESGNFKLRFGLRGHLGTVRTVIFSGGGSPGEPEICTAGDDGLIKRFHIPRNAGQFGSSGAVSDLDVQADFSHRGHNGAVLCLASWSPAPNFSTGGRAQGDGWIFSGGQDSSIRVWERGRVDPKDTLDGHTDAVWALCVLPATLGSIFGQQNQYGPADRILLASGAADGTVKIWAVSAPPQMTSPQPAAAGGRRAGGSGRTRGNSMSSGSAFPSSPQPTIATNSPFHHSLVHNITRSNSKASPTCITSLSATGESFVVSYSDAAIIAYDTRTGEEIGSMASLETYDGTFATSVNAVVATTVGLDQPQSGEEDAGSGGGPTGGGRAMAGSGVEGVIISGHEDRFVRFFDANSGQCTYNMLAHPAAISSLSLSPDGRELVSAGHDASLRFWSLEKRSCTQEITSHRIMRGEGVCAVVWSQDGRWVVSGGGDGIVKVFAR